MSRPLIRSFEQQIERSVNNRRGISARKVSFEKTDSHAPNIKLERWLEFGLFVSSCRLPGTAREL